MVKRTESPSEPLSRAIVAVFATGLRSQAAIAAIARSAPAPGYEDARIHSGRARSLTTAATLGEFVVDKLPFTPNRVDPAPLAGRAMFGAIAGGLIGRERGGSPAVTVVAGAMAAVVGSFAGYWTRKRVVERFGLPAFGVAVAEDGIAHGLGIVAAG